MKIYQENTFCNDEMMNNVRSFEFKLKVKKGEKKKMEIIKEVMESTPYFKNYLFTSIIFFNNSKKFRIVSKCSARVGSNFFTWIDF